MCQTICTPKRMNEVQFGCLSSWSFTPLRQESARVELPDFQILTQIGFIPLKPSCDAPFVCLGFLDRPRALLVLASLDSQAWLNGMGWN